jgi:hypothetical protein
VVPIATLVGESDLLVVHRAEHRQLKRGGGFEDWVVFKAYPTVSRKPSSTRATAPSEVITLPLLEATASQAKANPPKPIEPLARTIQGSRPAPPELPGTTSHSVQNGAATRTFSPMLAEKEPSEKGPSKFSLKPLFLGRRKKEIPQALPPPPPIETPIWFQPPHRVQSQHLTAVNLVPAVEAPLPPEPPSPPPRQAQPATMNNSLDDTTRSSRAKDRSQGRTGLRLPSLAEVKLRRAPSREYGSESQTTDGDQVPLEVKQLPAGPSHPDAAAVDGRDVATGISPDRMDEADEDEFVTSDEGEDSGTSESPLGTLSIYSENSAPQSPLSDNEEGARSIASTPWLDVAFRDLPFGSDVPAVRSPGQDKVIWLIITVPSRAMDSGSVAVACRSVGWGGCRRVCTTGFRLMI